MKIWVDVTSLCRQAAESLKRNEINPMINTNYFSLHESMSATELMDSKMDQCHNLGFLHDLIVDDLYGFPSFEFSPTVVAGYFIFLIKSEVAFFQGASVMETTHRCVLMWKEGIQHLEQRIEPLEKLVLINAKLFQRSISLVFNALIAADIYEDEDFCPAFKSYLFNCDENSADLIYDLNQICELVASNESYSADFRSIVRTFCAFRQAALLWAEHFETLVQTTVQESTKRLKEMRQSVHTSKGTNTLAASNDRSFEIFPLSLLSFKKTTEISESFCTIIKVLKSNFSKLFSDEHQTEEIALKSLDGGIRKDYLPRLYINGPRRLIVEPSAAVSLECLETIHSQVKIVYDHFIKEFACIEGEKIQASEPIELIIHKLSHLSSLRLHLIPRSYLVAFLHIVGTFLDTFIWNSVNYWGIPTEITLQTSLPHEWLQGNITAASWEVLRISTVNRNRIFARLEQIFSLWGNVCTEALYLDEKLIEDFSKDVGVSVANDKTSVYWFATWSVILSTTLMDFQMKLMIEMQIFDLRELDYFYWYWDYLISTHIHAADKLKPQNSGPTTAVLRGCGQLCRGIFRVILACKYLKLIQDDGPSARYSSNAVTFANRFKTFQEIINPRALTYHEFVATVHKDLAQLSAISSDSRKLRAKNSIHIVNSAIICFQNAKSFFDDSKKLEGFNATNLVNFTKTAIAAQLSAVKLKKFLESSVTSDAEFDGTGVQIKYPYNPHYGVLEFFFK